MSHARPEDYQLPENCLPVLVQLGLTYRCNLKCQHCYALYRRDRAELTLDEVRGLADQLHAAGSCSVVYSHGENLIRRDFHEVAATFRRLGFYQTLMTNGFYLRTLEDATALSSAGIDRVLVSLDSSDPAEHDRNRGSDGAFEVAVSSARLLKEAGLRTVGFSTTIDAYNYHRIRAVVGIAKDLGLDAISFMQNRYNRPGVFMRTQWREYVQVCAELYELILENDRIDIYTHDPFMVKFLDERIADPDERAAFIGANICNVGTGMVSIDPVGNVSGCNFLEEVIGNVREEPFAGIWDRLVERYSDRRNPPDGACTSCSLLAGCMGGCKAFHYNGKYDERCGETRFGDSEPHGLPVHSLPLYPTAPADHKAGVFSSSRRPTSRTSIP